MAEAKEDMLETTVLRLREMIGDKAELEDPDLEQDIKDECSNYGQVLTVQFYVCPDMHPHAGDIFVFLQYDSVDSKASDFHSSHAKAHNCIHLGVEKALKALHGRYFAGRRLVAEKYDETAFQQGDYSLV